METNKELLKSEVEEFRKVGHQFIKGELTIPEFKAKSGGMGVYAQKGGKTCMIRLRTPSGIINKSHMNLILSYVKKYKLERLHITTRQAVQLHGLDIDSICEIMNDAIDFDLYTRGAGGNFPRNVALSPLSGVDKNEVFDVTPYALIVGEYFMDHVTQYHLPRKLKVAFSNNSSDTACARIADIGFIAVEKEGGKFFQLYLAGGLGGSPEVALQYPELIRAEDTIYYVEAMVQLFMEKGDYQNKMKARTRFIPKKIGTEAFFECYQEHLERQKNNFELQKYAQRFADINSNTIDGNFIEPWNSELDSYKNVIPQKQKNLYSVILHPLCGQLLSKDYQTIVEFVNDNPELNLEIRLSMNEDIYLRNLTKELVEELHVKLSHLLNKTNIEMSVSCIGVPTCQIGILQSQMLCESIITAITSKNINYDLLPRIFISGCHNSCARHQTNALGFVGRKLRVGETVEDAFELYVGGNSNQSNAKIGESLGIMLAKEIPDFIIELAKRLVEKQVCYYEYILTEKDDFLFSIKKYINS